MLYICKNSTAMIKNTVTQFLFKTQQRQMENTLRNLTLQELKFTEKHMFQTGMFNYLIV